MLGDINVQMEHSCFPKRQQRNAALQEGAIEIHIPPNGRYTRPIKSPVLHCLNHRKVDSRIWGGAG